MGQPGKEHWQAVKRIFPYLRGYKTPNSSPSLPLSFSLSRTRRFPARISGSPTINQFDTTHGVAVEPVVVPL
ncbi:secreted RxLR effector protein 161-like protein [Salvia divinorum]|uniref:Secreted RxLR effector protein 161-like protein n=1 Tax=Salvia divinorum TaxID=28513 RepID=A0ABD1GJM1_SALDI